MQKTFIPILADFCEGLTLKDLPEDVVERAKVTILDAIASAYACHQTEPVRITTDVARQFVSNHNQATVWVKGYKTNYIFAAVNNSMLIHNMIHDDTNQSHRGHAGNLIVSTVLAIAEARQKSGADILPAIVMGYEAMGRIAAPAVAYSVGRGFRSTANYGPFGVATAAGKILGLSAEELSQAISCAASYAMGLLEPFNVGSMEWRFQNSVVIMGGVMAALYAQQGLKSAQTALQGDAGLFSAFCGKDVKDDIFSALMEESTTLGKEYDISRTIYKPYSTCAYNQIGCNIALNIIEKHSITPDMLKEIVVKVSPDNKEYPGVEYHGPFETIDWALLSKPFMLGAAVITKDLQVETYLNRLNDPEILEIAGMVRLVADKNFGALDTEIQFITKDGQVFKGDLNMVNLADLMLVRDSVIKKFHGLAEQFIDSSKIDEIADMVFNLEKLNNISELTQKLSLD